jgi:hypothetical protein
MLPGCCNAAAAFSLNSEIETTKGTKDHSRQEIWSNQGSNPKGEPVQLHDSLIFVAFRDFSGFHRLFSVLDTAGEYRQQVA